MDKPVMKITINSNDSFIDIYEIEPGRLVFETGSSNPLSPAGCGRFETDALGFLELLQKLVGK
ncbi:MAG: hypothetical protein JL50_21400 [Peptococcaceae bacterium BICA1-7]|nr:MAG: hypothetical protein JL50_21400 [Peptococcaceae bacterium BICA1-7]HBV97114.1 hypothetical protein [Desulfotomaculum sp.]